MNAAEEARSVLELVAQLDVPVREIDKVPPEIVLRRSKRDLNKRPPLRPLRFRIKLMCASRGSRLPLRVLHGIQEQTTFSQVVVPPRSRGTT